MCHIFSSQGVKIHFVELEADVGERLVTNKTSHRLEQKPTKRNINQSELHLLSSLKTNRLNSFEGEVAIENYLRINNTKKNAREVAHIIKETFDL